MMHPQSHLTAWQLQLGPAQCSLARGKKGFQKRSMDDEQCVARELGGRGLSGFVPNPATDSPHAKLTLCKSLAYAGPLMPPRHLHGNEFSPHKNLSKPLNLPPSPMRHHSPAARTGTSSHNVWSASISGGRRMRRYNSARKNRSSHGSLLSRLRRLKSKFHQVFQIRPGSAVMRLGIRAAYEQQR